MRGKYRKKFVEESYDFKIIMNWFYLDGLELFIEIEVS